MTQARDLADGKFDTDTLVVDAANNRVGVGTASPASSVNVVDTSSTANVRLESGSGTPVILQTFASTSAGGAFVDVNSDHPLVFRTNATERARVTNNGLTFNGDTAAANALDDYEEGTWTVNIKKGGSALAVGTRYGNYVKVGKLLWISFYWLNTSISTSGSSDYTVEGMPYNVDLGAGSGYQFVPSGYFNIGSTNVFNSEPHRWQANATDKLTMYGASSTDNVSSGLLQFHGTGVLQVA